MAADQYYVSLADSFGDVLEDLAIEITTEDRSISNIKTTPATASDKKCKSSPLQFALDTASPRKKQKMFGSNNASTHTVRPDADTTSNASARRGGGKWQKLRSSVQRKMTEIQDEKKQILSIGSRISSGRINITAGANDGPDVTTNAAIAFHLRAQEEEQFQQVLLVKSNSTCSSTSTDGSASTDEGRQSTENCQRRHYDEERYTDDIIDELLSPIEEGEEDEDNLTFSSSEEGADSSSSKTPRQGFNYSTRQFNGTSLRSQLEDAFFALDIANKEKKVLQGQVDAMSFKLGKLRKVIQQRSMENSKLNMILDSKNASLEKQNKQLGILDRALKQSQEKNEKLEREIQQLRRQLSTAPSRRSSLSGSPSDTSGTFASASIGASASVRERVSVFASSPMKLGADSSASGNPSKPSVANAFKEKTRFFSTQSSSLDAKQKYMKLSSPDQQIRKVFSPNASCSSSINSKSSMKTESTVEASPPDESFISVMAKKFSDLQVKAGDKEDSSMARNELEAIRQNHLQGKVQGSKSSLEFAFTHPPKTPKTPVAETNDGSVLTGTFFSPLRARIDLLGLESSCTGGGPQAE